MREFQSMVRKMLKDQRRRRRYTAFIVALSMIVTLIVPLGMMKPAISAVNGDVQPMLGDGPARTVMAPEDSSDLLAAWESGNFINDAPAEAPAGAIDFRNNITEVNVTPMELDGGDSTSASGSFVIDYVFGQGSGVEDKKYITYKLDTNVLIADSDIAGPNAKSIDNTQKYSAWRSAYLAAHPEMTDEGTTAGYYTINQSTGTLIIKFTPLYLEYIRAQNGEFQGKINFEGEVLRAKDEDGDRTFNLGGTSKDISATFNTQPVELNKQGRIVSEDYEEPLIEWTVTLTNPMGWYDFSQAHLDDKYLSQAVGDIVIEPAGAGTYNSATNKIDLNDTNDTSVKVTYFTKGIPGQDAENKVNFKDDSGIIKDKQAEHTVTIPDSSNISIAKSATPSYEIDGSAGENGYLLWTMTITKNYGADLSGFEIADSMWTEAAGFGGITETVPPNALSPVADGKATVTGSDVKGRLVITYKTLKGADWNSVKTHENTVTVTPPGDDPQPETTTVTGTYDDTALVDITKSGEFDINSNSIVWTVEAWTKNNNKLSLSEYEIQDDQFANAENITILSAQSSSGNAAADSLTAQKNGDTIKIVGADDLTRVKFSYSIKLTDEEISDLTKLADGAKKSFPNTVTIKDPKNPEGGKTVETDVKVDKLQNRVGKSIVGARSKTDTGYNGHSEKPASLDPETISWSVSIDSYSKLSATPYTDTISSTGGSHYLAEEFPSDFKIYASNTKGGTDHQLVNGTHFTVTYTRTDGRITGYTINFNESADDYRYLSFGYDTKADTLSVDPDTSASFTNEGTIGVGTDGHDTYEFTREKLPTVTLTTDKIWHDPDSEHRKNISVTLYQRAGTSGAWAVYNYPADSGRSSTVELTSANGYKCDWGELPKYTDDGTLTPYYYKIVEDKSNISDDYTESYSFNTDNGVNESGSLNVTNTYNKVCITVDKTWADGITKYPVNVQLERKAVNGGDNEWSPVDGKTAVLDDSNSWHTVFHDLDKGYVYRVAETAETEQTNLENGVRSVNSAVNGVTESSNITIHNEQDVTNITARKKWDGDELLSAEELAAVRPSKVTFMLKYRKDGESDWKDVTADMLGGQPASKDITSADWNAAAAWTGLPSRDKTDGRAYFYNVEEETVENYQSAWSGIGRSDSGDLTVVNTYDNYMFGVAKSYYDDGGHEDDRPDEITFRLEYRKVNRNDGDPDWRPVGESATVTLHKDSSNNYDTQKWAPQPKQDESGNELEYRIVELNVPYDFDVEAPTSMRKSGTYTVVNRSNRISISVNKTWKQNVKNRPNKINFTLERRSDLTDWEEVSTGSINTAYGDGRTEIKYLEQYDDKGHAYYYRVVEAEMDGFTPTYSAVNADSFSEEDGARFTRDGSLNIYNDDRLVYTKTAVDYDDDSSIQYISEQNVMEGTFDIDGDGIAEDIYIFKYKLTTSGTGVFEDIIPTGYTFLYSENPYYDPTGMNAYAPLFTMDNSYGYMKACSSMEVSDFSSNASFFYDSAVNKVYFNMLGRGTMTYYIAIPVENFPEMTSSGVTIENTVKSVEPEGEEVKADLKVTADKDYIDKDYVVKKGSESSSNVTYSIDINPESKNLSKNGSNITVEDMFYINGYTEATDYIDAFSKSGYKPAEGQSTINVTALSNVPNGSDIVLTLQGTAGKKVGAVVKINGNVVYTPTDSDVFDSSGLCDIRFRTNTELTANGTSIVVENNNTGDGYSAVSRVDVKGASKEGTAHQYSSAQNIMDANLESIVVRDAETGAELEKGSYEYEVVQAPGRTVVHDLTKTADPVVENGTFIFGDGIDIHKGTIISVKLKGTPNAKVNGFYWAGNQAGNKIENTNFDDSCVFDAKGEFIFNYTIPVDLLSADGNATGFRIRNAYYQGNITGYEVLKAEYTEQVFDSDSYIRFSLPDGKHITIEYTYALRTNENTPGSTETDAIPASGTKILTSNKAVIYADDRTERSESVNNELLLEYNKNSAQNESSGMPVINKVNLGNFTIDSLSAEFRIAKFIDGCWVYANEFKDGTGDVYDLEFDEANKIIETEDKLPEGAGIVALSGKTKVRLDAHTLYKLVETKAPTGYKPSPFESNPNVKLSDMEDFVFYFVNAYSKNYTDIPDGFDISVAEKVSGYNAAEVPNVQLIDIKAVKKWEGQYSPEGIDGTVRSRVQLFWSYKQSATIPADAVLADKDKLKIDDADFTNTYWITAGDESTSSALWHDLPNGLNGERIYYYIKETAYSIGDSEYMLQPDGTFKEKKSGIIGSYQPIYTGNGIGINETDAPAEVEINNSQSLVITKEWHDIDNKLVPGDKVEFNEVGFALYGVDDRGRKTDAPLITGKITKADNWTVDLSGRPELEGYSDFVIEEVVDDPSYGLDLTNEQVRTLRKMYSVSYTKNINNGTGEIRLNNKNSTPKITTLYVDKKWADTKTGQHPDITARIYKTLFRWNDATSPTEAELAESELFDTVILNAGNRWSYKHENIHYVLTEAELASLSAADRERLDKKEPHWWYYVIEEPLSGEFASYTTEYDYEGDKNGVYVDIVNRQSDRIMIEKEWLNSDNVSIDPMLTVELYRTTTPTEAQKGMNGVPDLTAAGFEKVKNITLKAEDGWKLTLSNLPKQDSSSKDYYYFIKEPDGSFYDVSYENNGLTMNSNDGNVIKLTNTVRTIDLKVRKVWSDGDTIDHTADDIVIKVTRTKGTPPDSDQTLTMQVDESTVYLRPDDSITLDVANSELFTVMSADTSSAVAEVDGGKVKITGVTDDTRTIVTVTDKATGVKRVIPVIVTSQPLPVLTLDTDEITAGETADMTITMSDGSAASSPSFTVTEGSMDGLEFDAVAGTVKGIRAGTYKFKVNVNGKESDEVSLTVSLPSDFTVPAVINVEPNGTEQITPEPPYGDFTYSVVEGDAVTVDENGMITAGSAIGTAVIEVTRSDMPDSPKRVTVNVKQMGVTYTLGNDKTVALENKPITKIIVDLESGTNTLGLRLAGERAGSWHNHQNQTIATITVANNDPNNAKIESGDMGTIDATVVCSDGVLTVQFATPVTAAKLISAPHWAISGTSYAYLQYNVTVFYEDTASANAAPKMMMKRSLMAASSPDKQTVNYNPDATFDKDGYIIVELRPSQGGKLSEVINDLPVCDKYGVRYYYQAEEIVGKLGYEATYEYSGGTESTSINAESAFNNNEKPEITVTNTKQESEGTTLPNTGGTGTAPYTAAGAVLCSTAAVIYVAKRRRRKQ